MQRTWMMWPDSVRTSTGKLGSVTSHLEMSDDGAAYRAVVAGEALAEHARNEPVETSLGMQLCGLLAADKERELKVYKMVGDDVGPTPKVRFL